MASMNHVILAGNLTADPELRYTKNTGMAAVRMTLAVNRKDKRGESVAYVTLKALGKLAELANQYLHKGSGVLIEGRLETGFYEKDGQRHYTTEVLLNELQFLDRAGSAPASASADDESLDDAEATPF
jgi:single-strand DNA-binding protein